MKQFTILVSLIFSLTICYAAENEVSIAINRLIDEQLYGVEYAIEKQPNHPMIDRFKVTKEFLLQLKDKSMLEKAVWAIPILENEVKAIESVFDNDPEKRTEKTIKIYRQKQEDLNVIRDWYSKNQ